MPEGPEVRKYADALEKVLAGRAITSLQARTKDARAWLQENESRVVGKRVERVVSHGKHLIGYVEGDFFFQSHLMMWGRWQTFAPKRTARGKSKQNEPLDLPEKDRRERARIVVEGGAAILFLRLSSMLGKAILTTESKTWQPSARMRCLTTGFSIAASFSAVCVYLITATSLSVRHY